MSDYLVFRAEQISGSNPVVPLHQVQALARRLEQSEQTAAGLQAENARLKTLADGARDLVRRIMEDLRFRAQFRDDDSLDLSHGLVLEAAEFRDGKTLTPAGGGEEGA